jgi:hypothetical protein
MLFGKLSYAMSPKSSAELSLSNRHETDIRDFGGNRSRQSAVNFRQDVFIGQARHTYSRGDWLNEAKVDFSRFRRRPEPAVGGIAARRFFMPGGEAIIGSNLTTQDFLQRRLGLRNDVTWSGWRAGGEHVIKMGASIDFVKYDIFKDNRGTPEFLYRDVEAAPPTTTRRRFS